MKIKNVNVAFLKESILASGYPMQVGEPMDLVNDENAITQKDLKRALRLAKANIGSGHDNFLKGIIVQFDLQYPEYFSPQLQRYNWVDIVSSQSKMHRLTSRELTVDDFTEEVHIETIRKLNRMIDTYNKERDREAKSVIFRAILSNLPSGYLKWMRVSTNYLQLKTIYEQRCTNKHKLGEWVEIGKMIKGLPMSELITQ